MYKSEIQAVYAANPIPPDFAPHAFIASERSRYKVRYIGLVMLRERPLLCSLSELEWNYSEEVGRIAYCGEVVGRIASDFGGPDRDIPERKPAFLAVADTLDAHGRLYILYDGVEKWSCAIDYFPGLRFKGWHSIGGLPVEHQPTSADRDEILQGVEHIAKSLAQSVA